MNTVDFYDALRQLFSDKKNFKIILKRFNFIQSNLCKQNEITKAQKKQIRPMSQQLGRTPALPNIYKVFTNILIFRLIIDTTNTPYYKIRQYL